MRYAKVVPRSGAVESNRSPGHCDHLRSCIGYGRDGVEFLDYAYGERSGAGVAGSVGHRQEHAVDPREGEPSSENDVGAHEGEARRTFAGIRLSALELPDIAYDAIVIGRGAAVEDDVLTDGRDLIRTRPRDRRSAVDGGHLKLGDMLGKIGLFG